MTAAATPDPPIVCSFLLTPVDQIRASAAMHRHRPRSRAATWRPWLISGAFGVVAAALVRRSAHAPLWLAVLTGLGATFGAVGGASLGRRFDRWHGATRGLGKLPDADRRVRYELSASGLTGRFAK